MDDLDIDGIISKLLEGLSLLMLSPDCVDYRKNIFLLGFRIGVAALDLF